MITIQDAFNSIENRMITHKKCSGNSEFARFFGDTTHNVLKCAASANIHNLNIVDMLRALADTRIVLRDMSLEVEFRSSNIAPNRFKVYVNPSMYNTPITVMLNDFVDVFRSVIADVYRSLQSPVEPGYTDGYEMYQRHRMSESAILASSMPYPYKSTLSPIGLVDWTAVTSKGTTKATPSVDTPLDYGTKGGPNDEIILNDKIFKPLDKFTIKNEE